MRGNASRLVVDDPRRAVRHQVDAVGAAAEAEGLTPDHEFDRAVALGEHALDTLPEVRLLLRHPARDAAEARPPEADEAGVVGDLLEMPAAMGFEFRRHIGGERLREGREEIADGAVEDDAAARRVGRGGDGLQRLEARARGAHRWRRDRGSASRCG